MDTGVAAELYREFLETRLSLLVMDQEGRRRQGRGPGLNPLLTLMREEPAVLAGALVFDKIIGAAAALLLTHGGAREVWTPVASRSGLCVLRRHRLSFRIQEIVAFIPNASGDGPCPFEKLAEGRSPKEFFAHVATRQGSRDHSREKHPR